MCFKGLLLGLTGVSSLVSKPSTQPSSLRVHTFDRKALANAWSFEDNPVKVRVYPTISSSRSIHVVGSDGRRRCWSGSRFRVRATSLLESSPGVSRRK